MLRRTTPFTHVIGRTALSRCSTCCAFCYSRANNLARINNSIPHQQARLHRCFLELRVAERKNKPRPSHHSANIASSHHCSRSRWQYKHYSEEEEEEEDHSLIRLTSSLLFYSANTRRILFSSPSRSETTVSQTVLSRRMTSVVTLSTVTLNDISLLAFYQR
jgi:hypothetical protein